MLNKSMREREIWIDILKGMAIILVVVGHNTPPSEYPWLNTVIYSFHMPLFFILSGFVFSKKPGKIYLLKSSKRLLLPFIAFCVVLELPDILKWLTSLHFKDLDTLRLILNKIIAGAVWSTPGWYTITWFVTVLWMSTNLFNYILNKKVKDWYILLILVVGYLLSFIPWIIPFRISVVPMAIAYIWIGFLIRKYISYIKSIKTVFYIIGGGSVLIIITLLGSVARVDMKFAYYGIPIVSLILSVVSVMFLGIIAIAVAKINILTKVFCLLGESSMVIMYLHIPMQTILVKYPCLTPALLFATMLGIIVPLIFYFICTKVKYLKKIFIGT